MPTTNTIELFEYSELSDSAKETARQWWIEAMDSSDFEFTIDDFVTIAGLMGVEVATRAHKTMGGTMRNFPEVFYNLGYSQSDYAAFEATYRYAKGGAAKVRQHAPQDEKLHAIALALQSAQAKAGYRATASIGENRGGLTVEVEEAPFEREAYDKWRENVEEPIKEAMRDLASWLYQRIREEHEYLTSDEQVAEAMESNGYTFRENGERED